MKIKCAALAAWVVLCFGMTAAEKKTQTEDLAATPLDLATLDAAAFTEWCDWAEHPIKPLDAKDNEHTPQAVVWTRSTLPGIRWQTFGDSKTPGARYLRIGFLKAIPAGSVLVGGGGQLSALGTAAARNPSLTERIP